MGLRDGTTDQNYYTEQEQQGGYQFISLQNIVKHFQIAYVGNNKIIPHIDKRDIAFYAQRALQELSFDTLKSFKAYQIEVPPALQMQLPHDYVNYTRLSWVDSSGIKHPLLPTNSTSNPFQIWQDPINGNEYEFPEDLELVVNGDFEAPTQSFLKPAAPWWRNGIAHKDNYATIFNNITADGSLQFRHRTRSDFGPIAWGHSMNCAQTLNVAGQDLLNLSAVGLAVDMLNGPGVLRVGITTLQPTSNTKVYPEYFTGSGGGVSHLPSVYNLTNEEGDPSYLEWLSTDGEVEKELFNINVKGHDQVYVLIVSFQDFLTGAGNESETITSTNRIDNISVKNSRISTELSELPGNEGNSSTWKTFKSSTSSENKDDYQDDTYWPADGSRFGLDPQHAQVNGSYFIDQRLGKIHFSSNISGKTVILDYISDSLGTDEEMQVHKFAEEAMYKHMAHGILSTSSYGQQLVPRLTKEKFAAIRKAKLRLSSIKLEELTQILRGKSKQIKH